MFLNAICRLVPCPLRDQLLDHDEEILHTANFEKDLLRMARAKFNEEGIKETPDSFLARCGLPSHMQWIGRRVSHAPLDHFHSFSLKRLPSSAVVPPSPIGADLSELSTSRATDLSSMAALKSRQLESAPVHAPELPPKVAPAPSMALLEMRASTPPSLSSQPSIVEVSHPPKHTLRTRPPHTSP